MSPTFITSVIGLALTVMALGQVGPSLYESVAATKASSNVSREGLLVQQILRYISAEGSDPANIAELISKGYWTTADNSNGFGGSYSFAIDRAKNQVVISTVIADDRAREQYLRNSRHVFRPLHTGSGVVSTTVVIPSTYAIGAPVASKTGIVAGATAPDPASSTYWYDTSSTTPALRVSNGTQWIEAERPAGGEFASSTGVNGAVLPNASNIVSSASALPTTAADGDVRYVYDAATSQITTVYYAGGRWLTAGSGENQRLTLTLASRQLPVGRVSSPFSVSFAPSMSAVFSNTGRGVSIDPAQVTWTVQGTLPTGLSFNALTGELSGTPTGKSARPPQGNTITVVATYKGHAGAQNYGLQVGPALMRAKSYSTGSGHSCLVTPEGAAFCWGSNDSGQVGNGATSYDQVTAPTPVSGLSAGVDSIVAGHKRTCALMTDRTVRCWGAGPVGNGSTGALSTPVAVSNINNAAAISVGGTFACATRTTGGVSCWGQNSAGELGNGGTTQSNVPVNVNGVSGVVKRISSGYNYTCVIDATDAVKCWGSNSYGQIGNGSTNPVVTTAVAPSNLSEGAVAITTGGGGSGGMDYYSHTCAATKTNAVKCWGSGSMGQLGTSSSSLVRPEQLASH